MELIIKYQKRKIAILAIIAVVMLCAAVPIVIMSFRNIGFLYAGIVYLAFAAVYAYVMAKELKRSKYKIVISPLGVEYDDGKVVKAEDISRCYMRYSLTREAGTGMSGAFANGGSTDGYYRMVIERKNGTKVFIDMSPYKLKDKDIETLHEKVNAIADMPTFDPPVIDDLR